MFRRQMNTNLENMHVALNIDDETFQLARTWREYAQSEKMLTRSRVMCFDADGLLSLGY